MRYLLDTNVISDFVRGHARVAARLKATPPAHLAVSVITAMEIEYGLLLNPVRAAALAPMLNCLLDTVAGLAFEREDARTAAALRAALRQQGTPIGAYDVLLAGCALRRGLIMVTANTSEFQRATGLCLENWRD